MGKLLDIQNLKISFGQGENRILATDGVQFSVNKGETIGIVGESGSGKSITALATIGLIPKAGQIEEGQIIYHPKESEQIDLLSLPSHKMRPYRGRKMAMVFQEPMTSLNPIFRCGDQMIESIRRDGFTKKEAKDIALDWFARVDLPEPLRIFKAYPHQISGGQRQRVMIALALSRGPELLIADEPTTALDVTVQKNILHLLQTLKSDLGISVIFISHDLGVIAQISDRVVVMYKGKVVEQGAVKQVFSNPSHAYTKGLIACRPPLEVRVNRLPVIKDFLEDSTSEEHQIKEQFKASIISSVQIKERNIALQKEEPLISVSNLSTWFSLGGSFFKGGEKYLKAVDEVSFKVYPGETLGLVGESGSGKTTLGRTLLRLTQAREGAVIFKGHNLLELSEKEMKKRRKDLQIVFQDPFSALNPRMAIGKALLEPLQLHGFGNSEKERKNRALELLDIVGLEERHFFRFPHEFSGGQRQRIGIARALAVNPIFIVCDESVSSLDVSVQAQILNLLMDLRKQFNLSYIFISHDLSVVRQMSDRMAVMKDGKIVEIGETEQIYKNPQQVYTQRLIDAIPKVEFA